MPLRQRTDDIPYAVMRDITTMLELRYDGPIPRDALREAVNAYKAGSSKGNGIAPTEGK